MEGQKANSKFFFYINPKTSFWPRMIIVALLLSAAPISIFLFSGKYWFEEIFGSGIYFTGCLGILSFLLKNYWDGNRRRYNALCALEAELLLQITTFQDNIDKMDAVIQKGIPVLTTPTFIEPDLKVLNDLARIEIKNDAFNLLSRVADLKASIDFHSKKSLEYVDDFKNPAIRDMAMERLKIHKKFAENFRDELKELDIRVKYFVKNDKPFWSVPILFFSKKNYRKFLKDEPERIRKYLEEKNKDREGPSYL